LLETTLATFVVCTPIEEGNMRQVIVIGILLLATAVMAAPSYEWDGSQPVPSVPYSWAPDGVRNPTNVAVFRDNLPWGSSRDDDILMANSVAFTVVLAVFN
jgi:hypothetical protein